ncbi:MAG TPA: hypothetical protein VF959_03680 [Casimicrobiaceae bacterium]
MRISMRNDCPAIPASNTPSPNNQRRRFLLAFGASGAGVVAAAAATIPAVAAAQASATPHTEADDGYRETTHVHDYYRTTRL